MKPTHTLFATVQNVNWLALARDVQRRIPMFEFANGSGKFFGNYQTWHFACDSSHPLVVEFMKQVELSRSRFESLYDKKLNLNFIVLAYVSDASEPLCIRHKDGYFFDGQLHLSILGGAQLGIESTDAKVERVVVEDGTFWYLNGSQYYHWVEPSAGERFELLAPVNQRPEDVCEKLRCVSQTPERYLDSTRAEWQALRHRQVEHVLSAVRAGRASNLKVAAFNRDFDARVAKHNQRLKDG